MSYMTELKNVLGLEDDDSLLASYTDVESDGVVEPYDETEMAITDPVDTLTKGMDDLADATVGMEEIFSAVSTFLQNGGMDDKCAIMTNLAVKAAASKFPLIEMPKMPGNESFGDAGSRMESSLLGLEAGEGWLRQAWNWIKAMVARFVGVIATTWKRWTLTASGIQTKAQKIRAAVASTPATASVAKSYNVSETDARNMTYGGTTTMLSMKKGLAALSEAIDKTAGQQGSDTVVTSYVAAVESVITDYTPQKGDDGVAAKFEKFLSVDDAVKMFIAKSGITYTESTEEAHVKDAKNGSNQYWVSAELLGSKRVVAKFKGSSGRWTRVGGKQKDGFKGIAITFGDAPGTKKRTGNGAEMTGITRKQCIDLLELVITITGTIAAAKTNSSARSTAVKAVEAAAKKIDAKLTEDKVQADAPALYSFVKDYMSACATLPQAVYNPGTELSRHALIVSKSVINVVVGWLKAYKDEAASA